MSFKTSRKRHKKEVSGSDGLLVAVQNKCRKFVFFLYKYTLYRFGNKAPNKNCL